MQQDPRRTRRHRLPKRWLLALAAGLTAGCVGPFNLDDFMEYVPPEDLVREIESIRMDDQSRIDVFDAGGRLPVSVPQPHVDRRAGRAHADKRLGVAAIKLDGHGILKSLGFGRVPVGLFVEPAKPHGNRYTVV